MSTAPTSPTPPAPAPAPAPTVPTPPAPAPTPADPAPPVTLESLQAQLAEQRAHISRLNAEAASHRKEAEHWQKMATAAATGDYKAQSEQLTKALTDTQAQLAQLTPLLTQAEAEVAALAAKAPPSLVQAVASLPVPQRLQVLRDSVGSAANTSPSPPAPLYLAAQQRPLCQLPPHLSPLCPLSSKQPPASTLQLSGSQILRPT